MFQREQPNGVPVQKPGDEPLDGLRLFRVQDFEDGPERMINS